MIQFDTLFPLYVAKDIAAQKSFYCTNFGFEAVFFDESFYVHLIHPDNRSQLGFMREDHPSQPEFLHRPAQTAGIVITMEVGDIDKALTSTEQAGLQLAFPRTEEPWGQIHFMVKDPAGLLVDIVQDANGS